MTARDPSRLLEMDGQGRAFQQLDVNISGKQKHLGDVNADCVCVRPCVTLASQRASFVNPQMRNSPSRCGLLVRQGGTMLLFS